MERVIGLLAADPSITAMTFDQITFWGGLDYWVDGWYLRRNARRWCCHRVFKWGPGSTYATHRPPTVLDSAGRDVRSQHWLTADDTARLGIRMHHYSLLLPKQVAEKSDYYANADWAKRAGAQAWARDAWMELNRPFRVHNVFDYPSWLERYSGEHPAEVVRMVEDLRRSGDPDALRRTDDIERLLRSPRYRLGRAYLKARLAIDGPVTAAQGVFGRARNVAKSMRRLVRRLLRRLGGRP
jgi:hypothetical protein